MFELFKPSNKLELVSIHIPKTAGTSFRNTLKSVYGEASVARLDIHIENKKVRLNEKLYNDNHLDYEIKVIHGHFCPDDLNNFIKINRKTLFITWLRDPVERVVSNYYYLAKRLTEILDEENNNLNILSKMQRSLIEYASDEISRNRMSKFLSGKELSKMAFVGIQEHYEEDLKQLAQLFNWDNLAVFKHNVTGSKYEVSESDRAKIAALNELDMAIYNEGLALRAQRLKKIK